MLVIVQNMPVPLDRRVWQECQTLRQAGYGVSVVCPRGQGQRRHQIIDGVSIHTYAPPPATCGALSYVVEFVYCWVRTLGLATQVRRREGFAVIQACNPPDTYFLLGLLFRPFGARFVFDQHDLCPEVYASRFGREEGWMYRGMLLLEQATYRTADHVIVTNESYRAVALERGECDPESVTVVRSGPDPRRMVRENPDPELRNGRRFLCCWLGIMGPQDGVDLLLRSIAMLVHEQGRDDCQFALLGYGDCLEDLRRLSTELGIDPWVTFTGPADAAVVSAYLSSSDIGLSADPLSPLNDLSTMNKTMEYMAYELPVVAYDLKETRVSADRAAIYVEPNDHHAYAKAISDLLDSPRERAERGAFGRARIENVLSWDRQADDYVAAFDRLVYGRRRSGPTPLTVGSVPSRRKGDLMKVAILAGGVGSRLAEETETKPKPMVEIGGQPILWHIMKHYAPLRPQRVRRRARLQGRATSSAGSSTTCRSRAISPSGWPRRVGRAPRRPVPTDWTVSLIDTGPAAPPPAGASSASAATSADEHVHADVGRRRLERRPRRAARVPPHRTASSPR